MKQSLKTKASATGKKSKAAESKVASKKSVSTKKASSKPALQVNAAPKQANPKPAAPKQAVRQLEASGEVQHHDILQMILDDHKPLKRLINVLKNLDLSLSARRSAFSEFAPLLTIHAKAEENTLYVHMKKEDQDLRLDGLEGDVEHSLASMMVEDIKQTVEKDVWSAKTKVLAELVEHHIEEEENEMFPEIKKEVEMMDLIRLGEDYSAEKEKIKMDVVHPPVLKSEFPQTIRH